MPDFPANPPIDTEFTANGVVYMYDGQKWVASGAGGASYLPLSGGSMLGPLHLFQDPLAALEAVPLRYLQQMLGAVVAGVEIFGVFEAVTGTIRWNSNSGQSGNVLPPPTAALEGRYLICSNEGDVPPTNAPLEHYLPGDWLICSGTAWFHIHVATTITADEIALNSAVAGAANVQDGLEAMVPLAGGVMTGQIVTIPPVAGGDAANKAYVDNKIAAIPPSGIGEAPLDGQQYGRQSAAWSVVSAGGGGDATITYVDAENLAQDTAQAAIDDAQDVAMAAADALRVLKAGDVMTGFLTLNADPTANLHPATKAYADARLPFTGGTMTGFITTHADPTLDLHVANKRYVDLNKPGKWIEIASKVPTAATTLAFTDIPLTYSALMILGNGIRMAAQTAGLVLDVSTNNGATWSTGAWPVRLAAPYLAPGAAIITPLDAFVALFEGYSNPFGMVIAHSTSATGAPITVRVAPKADEIPAPRALPASPATVNPLPTGRDVITGVENLLGGITIHTGGCNAFRVRSSTGDQFQAAGTIKVYAR